MRLAMVVCPSYHGATLLGLLLNNHSEISALADTLPPRGVGQPCACGLAVEECEFWKSATAGLPSPHAHDRFLLPAMPWPLRRHHLEGGLVRVSDSARVNRAVSDAASVLADALAPIAWRLRPSPVEQFVATCHTFYARVLELQRTSIVVDGHKGARRAALLAQRLQPDGDVRILHLVRDPRGFAASYRRHHGEQDVRGIAWLWAARHRRMHALRTVAPYHRLRYEDLCRTPQAELDDVLDFLGVEPQPLLHAPRQPEKHHLVGNRMLDGFTGSVTLDERWREALTPGEQQLILRCSGDLATRFGYTSGDGSHTQQTTHASGETTPPARQRK